jgi:hypothetical protein
VYDLYDDLENMCHILSEELAKTNEEINRMGGVSKAGLDYVDKLTHALKSVITTKAMIGADDRRSFAGDGGNGGGNGGGQTSMSFRRGERSYAPGRGGTHGGSSSYNRSSYWGPYYDRFSSYKGGEEMIEELRELEREAPNKEIREEFRSFIDRLENM